MAQISYMSGIMSLSVEDESVTLGESTNIILTHNFKPHGINGSYELYEDSTLIKEKTTLSNVRDDFTVQYTPSTIGTHIITAKMYDFDSDVFVEDLTTTITVTNTTTEKEEDNTEGGGVP